jgi:DNA-binding transcriptional regulator LsrR (DeoR family)
LADRDMMRLVAELYYERDLRQPEVAAMTGFSVSKVSRLLSAARELGIVRITVEPPAEAKPRVAADLAERFGIQVSITPGQERDPAASARLCGLGAAEILVANLPDDGPIGIAAGYTVGALVSALPKLERPDLTVIPIVGGWDTQQLFLDGNQMARRMAERLGAPSRTLHAPAVLDTPEMKQALLRDSTVAATASQWPSLELTLIGIGGSPSAHPGYRTAVDRLGEDTRDELARLGAVGDIAGHFLRLDGTVVETWSSRTLAIPVELLRTVPNVFAVAAGSTKIAAILGALRSGLLRHLVTDRPTAEAVLRRATSGR